jgi:hypothetical protein
MEKEENKSLVKEPDLSYGNYTLIQGKYRASRWMTKGDIAKSSVIAGFELDLEEFFSNMKL